MNKATRSALSVLCMAILTACGSDTNISEPIDQADTPLLKRYSSAADFDADLRAALNASQGTTGGYGGETDDLAATSNEGGVEGSADSADASNVSQTNVQEQGVDESDRVKVSADGSTLYVLHSEYEAVPYATSDIACPADGECYGGGAITTQFRILSLDAESPDATVLGESTLDLSGRGAQGFYLYDTDQVVLAASGQGNWYGHWEDSYAFANQDGQIVKIDASTPTNVQIDTRLTIEGQIISSRRIGDSLIFVSRHYPVIEGVDPWSVSAEEWQNAVNSADLADLMPSYQIDDGAESALADPANCFSNPLDRSNQATSYYSPDIITMAVVDLTSMTLSDSMCYMGATETLYASTDAVVLATTTWDYAIDEIGIPEVAVDPDSTVSSETDTSSDEYYEPTITTELHQFSFANGQLSYAGSGSVDGHLGWSIDRRPYRMSMKDGYLRVATMADPWNTNVSSPIRLSVLKADGNGLLQTVAKLPNDQQTAPIGKPGETLYASRFVGDRAYLVTFRQTDPLYVIDLADPNNPEVKGELEIDGYSDYLHPLADGYLLGIGMDAVASDFDERGGLTQGVKLSLFDVRDASNPQEVDSLRIGQRGSSSNALYNPRAITVLPDATSGLTRLAISIDVHGDESGVIGSDPQQWYPWNKSALYGFDISTDVNASIAQAGSLTAEQNESGNQYGGYGDGRSVMVDDAVFYIHNDRVYAADWDNLSAFQGPR